MKLGREECRKKIQAFTSEFNLKEGSHSSQATFLRSEQVLNKSWASGWNTEKMVVSFTEICMSFFWKKKKLVGQHEERWDKEVDDRLPFRMMRTTQRCSCAVALL